MNAVIDSLLTHISSVAAAVKLRELELRHADLEFDPVLDVSAAAGEIHDVIWSELGERPDLFLLIRAVKADMAQNGGLGLRVADVDRLTRHIREPRGQSVRVSPLSRFELLFPETIEAIDDAVTRITADD